MPANSRWDLIRRLRVNVRQEPASLKTQQCKAKLCTVRKCFEVVFMNLTGSAGPVQSLADCAETSRQNYRISRTAKAQPAFKFNIPILTNEKWNYTRNLLFQYNQIFYREKKKISGGSDNKTKVRKKKPGENFCSTERSLHCVIQIL